MALDVVLLIGKAFEGRLDYEVSDFTDWLIHQWSHNLMSLLEEMKSRKWGSTVHFYVCWTQARIICEKGTSVGTMTPNR